MISCFRDDYFYHELVELVAFHPYVVSSANEQDIPAFSHIKSDIDINITNGYHKRNSVGEGYERNTGMLS